MFERTLKRLADRPARWHLIVSIAETGDVTDKATEAWPEGRRTVDVGTLVIDKTVPEASGNCRDEVFDPTILPTGMAPSAAYSSSLTRRASEGVRSMLIATEK
ncbi:hypothetical protein GCM10011349_42490 [Novosphingobium indicum]|uniref:Catalase n=1 Tax=Novosphingobium indicum TaxID=462949 RepID=A0ABQ2K0F5_9SPHN|nr:hypothetical protein [Novosphingobium indicum]GGN60652.1 hypothetical protein GCM10011349_42490 [Novosphingobium indicum]